jgi:hypothetical protein
MSSGSVITSRGGAAWRLYAHDYVDSAGTRRSAMLVQVRALISNAPQWRTVHAFTSDLNESTKDSSVATSADFAALGLEPQNL